MFYVCEGFGPRPLRFLAGPYDTEPEAAAAAGAIEADTPEFRAKTFIWQCGPAPDSVQGPYSGTADTTPLR